MQQVQVNVLTQMMAGMEATAQVGSASSSSAMPDTGGLEFLMMLQQQVWAGGQPGFANGQPDAQFTDALAQAGADGVSADGQVVTKQAASADASAMIADASATLTGTGVTLTDSSVVSTDGATATTATSTIPVPQLELSEMLQALIDGLKQLLDAATEAAAAPDAQAAASSAAGEALTTGTGQQVATGSSLSALYPALAALESWQQAVSQLNTELSSELGGNYRVVSSQPELQGTGQAKSQLPWVVLGSTASPAEKLASTLAQGSATSAATADGEAAAGLAGDIVAQDLEGFGVISNDLANTPEVIQWFVRQGLLGEAASTSTQTSAQVTAQANAQAKAATATLAMQAKAAITAKAQPAQTMTGTVQLASCEEAKLTLSLLSQGSGQASAADASQSAQYAVRLEIPGDPASVITATLSVERVEFSLPTQWTGVNGLSLTPPVFETLAADGSQVAAVDLTAALADAENTVTVQTAPVSVLADTDGVMDIVAADLAVTDNSFVLEQPTAVGLTDLAATISVPVGDDAGGTELVQDVEATLMAVKPAVVDDIAVETPVLAVAQGVLSSEIQPAGRKQASPVTEPAVADAEAAVVDTSAVALGTEESLIEQAMALASQDDDASSISEFTALSRLAAKTILSDGAAASHPSVSLLIDNTGQTLLASGQQQLASSLLEFSQTQDVPQSLASSSLNYLELAQQVLDETAQARSNGDGTYVARLNLNPPNLGQLSVNIAVRGENVSLQMAVVSSAPKAKLDESMAQLKQSLEESGLTVVELKVVQVGNEGEGGGQGGQHQQEQQQPQAGKQTAVLEPDLNMAAMQNSRAASAVPAAS